MCIAVRRDAGCRAYTPHNQVHVAMSCGKPCMRFSSLCSALCTAGTTRATVWPLGTVASCALATLPHCTAHVPSRTSSIPFIVINGIANSRRVCEAARDAKSTPGTPACLHQAHIAHARHARPLHLCLQWGLSAAPPTQLRVLKFTEEVLDGITVHFHLILYDGGAYAWVGRGGALESLAVAIPTRCVRRPGTTAG
jgi:hypothetical protein